MYDAKITGGGFSFTSLDGAKEAAPEPHVHRFEIACQCDDNGFTVYDCGCGERYRARKLSDGSLEYGPKNDGPLGDVILDRSNLGVNPILVSPK